VNRLGYKALIAGKWPLAGTIQGMTSADAGRTDPAFDSVDRMLREWHDVRPELDFRPVGVVTRLRRVRGLLDHELEATFAEFGLGAADFEALVTLNRKGAPYQASQRTLMADLGLTSGTVSVRVDRLVGAGLVSREPDPTDGRGSLVALTTKGLELLEAAIPAHLANEERLLSALTDEEQDTLADLLRKLLASYEGGAAGAARVHLGLTLAPAHVARAMRRAVGLPEQSGLLVRAVEPSSPAARAGLREGDLLVAAGGRDLRSITSLYQALGELPSGAHLGLTVVRGLTSLDLTIHP
jgi:DNA-binding MarR family transcriptional regulator